MARKVPELCKAYTPGKTDQDIGVRLSRLEHIIEMALPQFFSSGTPSSSAAFWDRRRSGSTGFDDDIQSQHEEQDPSGGTFQSGKWYGNSASGSVATASVLEQVGLKFRTYYSVISKRTSQLANAVAPNSSSEYRSPGGSSQLRPGNGVGHKSPNESLHIVESIRQDSEPSAADRLKSLVQDCGVSPHKLSELLQELPPQRFSDVLIDYYFSQMYVFESLVNQWTCLDNSIVTGLAILSPNATSAHPILQYARMALVLTRMMSASFHCCLSFSPFLCDLPQII
jgi:hypothetical protein